MALSFKPVLLPKVLNGTKTRTWRPLSPNEMMICRLDDGSLSEPMTVPTTRDIVTVLTAGGRVKHQVGRNEAIKPGMYEPSVGRFDLVQMEYCTPAEISHQNALAEGFTSVDEFLAYVQALYPKKSALDVPGVAYYMRREIETRVWKGKTLYRMDALEVFNCFETRLLSSYVCGVYIALSNGDGNAKFYPVDLIGEQDRKDWVMLSVWVADEDDGPRSSYIDDPLWVDFTEAAPHFKGNNRS